MELQLPPQAALALRMLEQAGFEAYVVGGAVRDALRGCGRAEDWDITTSALPQQTEQVFSGFRLIETGLRHGTVTVLLDGVPLEITTYRVDGDYTDHRRPDAVRFTPSLAEDLARRDFTMNALAYNPRCGLVDLHGGAADLAAGVVRCVGQPQRRFQEDALRILRALRFAAVFDLQLEPETAAALRACRTLLRDIAAERVSAELTKLLCGPAAARILRDYGAVIAVVIPELTAMFGFQQHNPHHDRDVWAHTLAVVQASRPKPVARWAALLHDVGKPGCFSRGPDGVGHFYGHAARSAELAEGILTRLRFDSVRRSAIVRLVQAHDQPLVPEERAVKRLLNRFGPDLTLELLALHRADTAGQAALCQDRRAVCDRAEALARALIAQQACFSLRDLAVNGRDMLALGLQGREVGTALSRCLDAVMDGTVPNERAALLEFAGGAAKTES